MAGMVGKQADVSLVDERIESARHERNANIAIIFINSYNQQRAYDLAKKYKTCGSTVVFTGPMLNDASNGAEKHADCLFIGSGEDNLPSFLTDFQKGKSKPFYLSPGKRSGTGTADIYDIHGFSLAS